MWRQIQMSPVMTNNNWGVLQEKAIFIYWITSHQLIKESSWCQEQTPDMMITYTEWKRSPFFNNPWPSCHLYTSLTYRSICSHLCIAIALQSWDQGEGLFSFSFFFPIIRQHKYTLDDFIREDRIISLWYTHQLLVSPLYCTSSYGRVLP